jgi:hypothetical protein
VVEKPTDRYRKAEKGQRRVRDPITGTEIIVKDADPKGQQDDPVIKWPGADKVDFDSTVPATKGSNILHHPFPPAAPASIDGLLGRLKLVQFAIAGGMFLIWVSVAWGGGIMAFLWRSTICTVLAFGLMTAVSLVERGIEKEIERVRQDLSRQRGEAFSPPMPESVEWLNGLIKLMWGIVDP